MRKSDTVEGRVSLFYLLWNTLLPVGLLFFLLRYKLNCGIEITLPIEAVPLWNCLVTKAGTVLLCILFIYLFLAVSWDSKLSIDIGRAAFADARRPKKWRLVENRAAFTWIVGSNIFIFVGLAWFVDYLPIFSVLSAIFYLNACLYMISLRKNVQKYFSDITYKPSINDPHAAFIERRRKLIDAYVKLPHLAREVLMVISCLVAAVASLLTQHVHSRLLMAAPFAIIGIAMLINEATMFVWRRQRNRAMDKIDQEEASADAALLGER